MRKALNIIFLWMVLFLAFQAFACKSVQKTAKEEPEEAAVTVSQTNTTETGKAKAGGTETGKKKAGGTETGKKKVSSTGTGKAKAGGTETGKKKAVGTETGKSKQGARAELEELKEEVITEAEKILNPTIKKAILPSGVILLILISLMSSKKDRKREDD